MWKEVGHCLGLHKGTAIHMEKVPDEGVGGGVVVVGCRTHGNSKCEVCSRNRTLWPEQNEL